MWEETPAWSVVTKEGGEGVWSSLGRTEVDQTAGGIVKAEVGPSGPSEPGGM